MTLRVDIASSETTLDRVDLRVGGAMPFVLARRYRSNAPAGIFGAGWQHGFDRTLRIDTDRVIYRDGSGREVAFAPVPVGMEAKHPEGLTLQHHDGVWVVFASPLAQEVYRKGKGDTLLLERIVDPNGNRVKLDYSGGRLAVITGAAGQRVRFAYSGAHVGQITVVGADGREQLVRAFRYGPGGTLVAETDADGRTTEYAYDRGLLVRAGTPGGAAWLAQYDTDRRCTALWRSDGTAVHHIAYDALRQTTCAVGTDGRQTLYRHAIGTSGSVVLERIDTEAESLNYYYDEAQRLIGYADAGGTVVTFQRFDPEKGEHFQMDRESRLWSATLGPSQLIHTIEGANDGEYVFGYDERFNLVGLTTPLGAAWTFERDGKGRLSGVVSPAGRRIAISRDGPVLTVEDGEGMRQRLTLDLLGRMAVREDRSEREQHFQYDREGRLLRVEVGDEYRMTCDVDAAGRPVRLADSERRQARWTRDEAGRPLSIETEHGAVRFAYDLAGRIRNATGDAGDVKFGYDEQDRLRYARGARWMTFSYEDGQLTVKTEGEQRVFSAHGELLEETAPGGGVREFLYGIGGELLSAEERTGDETTSSLYLTYDDDGRLTEVSQNDDTATFSYDLDGLLVQAEANGRVFRLDYDGRFQPTALRVDEALYHFAFDDGGRLTELRGAEGERCRLNYDLLDRCQSYATGESGERQPATDSVERVSIGDGLDVLVASRGVAVVAHADGLVLPLWGREEMRLEPLSLDARTVRSLVRGPEAALAPMPETPGPPVRQWQRLANTEGLEIGVPNATVLGVPWSVLDLFALNRERYDPHCARRLPGILPSHQPDPARAPDVVTTGSHRMGVLQPAVWEERAHGSHLISHAPLAPPGGIPDDLALRLYRALTQS